MVDRLETELAEVYKLYDIACDLYSSEDETAILSTIEDKDATIISMSKFIVNMMDMLKVGDLKPAMIKRAHAMRESGSDKGMKRILPKAVNFVTNAIIQGSPSHNRPRRRDRYPLPDHHSALRLPQTAIYTTTTTTTTEDNTSGADNAGIEEAGIVIHASNIDIQPAIDTPGASRLATKERENDKEQVNQRDTKFPVLDSWEDWPDQLVASENEAAGKTCAAEAEELLIEL